MLVLSSTNIQFVAFFEPDFVRFVKIADSKFRRMSIKSCFLHHIWRILNIGFRVAMLRSMAAATRCKLNHKDRYQQEVDRNYEEFQKMLPNLLAIYRDKYALMKDGNILGYYSTAQDAAMAAQAFISDGVFSIQQVTSEAINLGFFTYAVPVDTVQP